MTRRFKRIDLFTIVNYIIFAVLVFLCVYPFYYIFVFSISDPMQAIKGISFFPRGLTATNYEEVMKLPGLLHAALVSVVRTVVGTFVTVICCSFFAFLMTKEKMYFRKAIYRFVVITMYLNSGLIPAFLTMRAYGLNNNFLIYILPSAIVAYYVILLKTFFEQIPASLEEAAYIDGAGTLTVYSRIIMPVAKPIIATISVFAAVGQWNSWFDNLIYMGGRHDLDTLQLLLYNLVQKASVVSNQISMGTAEQLAKQVTPDSIRMTVTIVVTLPILFVYPFAQKYFVKGLVLGAVKG